MARQINQKLIAGDTFKTNFNAYPYSGADGYSLHLYLIGPSGAPQRTEHTGTAGDGTTFEVRIAPAVTANLSAGLFGYSVVASNVTDSFTVESGNLTVEARADLNMGTDLRTHNIKVYDAICAVIEGRATQDQASYAIAGRQLTRTPIRDLLELKQHYKDLVHAEEGKSQKKMYIRFS